MSGYTYAYTDETTILTPEMFAAIRAADERIRRQIQAMGPICWQPVIDHWKRDFDDELDWLGEWRGRRG